MANPTRILKRQLWHESIHIAREQTGNSLCGEVHNGHEVGINVRGKLCVQCLALWTQLETTPTTVLNFAYKQKQRPIYIDWSRLRAKAGLPNKPNIQVTVTPLSHHD